MAAVLGGMTGAMAAGCGSAQETGPPPREPVEESGRFSFYADPDVNLHHLLYHWARALNGQALTTVVEMEDLDHLSEAERTVWEGAVQAYWRNAGTRNLLFDDDLVALRSRIVGRRGPEGLPDRDVRLYEAMERARPVYRAHWADAHRSVNEDWVRALMADLPAIEDRIGEGITGAYDGQWPGDPVVVDVSPYTNRVGGYTTSDFHVMISSTDSANVMPQALEILFHEASHGNSLEGPVHEMLREAFAAQGGEPPDQLWHAVLFVTAGESTAMAYEEIGRPGYVHYGDVTGLYARGAWTDLSAALKAHWVPYLRGDTDRASALDRVAGELGGR